MPRYKCMPPAAAGATPAADRPPPGAPAPGPPAVQAPAAPAPGACPHHYPIPSLRYPCSSGRGCSHSARPQQQRAPRPPRPTPSPEPPPRPPAGRPPAAPSQEPSNPPPLTLTNLQVHLQQWERLCTERMPPAAAGGAIAAAYPLTGRPVPGPPRRVSACGACPSGLQPPSLTPTNPQVHLQQWARLRAKSMPPAAAAATPAVAQPLLGSPAP